MLWIIVVIGQKHELPPKYWQIVTTDFFPDAQSCKELPLKKIFNTLPQKYWQICSGRLLFSGVLKEGRTYFE